MPDAFEVVSVLAAVEFVVMAAFVVLLVPFEAAAPVLPLLLVFLVALHRYRSRTS